MEVDDSHLMQEKLSDEERLDHSGADAAADGQGGDLSPGSGVGLPDRDESAPGDGADKGRPKKHRRGKHKGGQRHNKQWKPYHKLTWDERRQLEERETVRANQKREKRFQSGQPMAPYNTTQFLMEQHQSGDTEFVLDEKNPANRGDGGSGSVDSSDEYYDSPEDEDSFMAKEFSEAYENVHAERLQNMSKDELVKEFMELESKLERLERLVKDSKSVVKENGSSNGDIALPNHDGEAGSVEMNSKDVATDKDAEIQKLREENERLKRENERILLNKGQDFSKTAKLTQMC